MYACADVQLTRTAAVWCLYCNVEDNQKPTILGGYHEDHGQANALAGLIKKRPVF